MLKFVQCLRMEEFVYSLAGIFLSYGGIRTEHKIHYPPMPLTWTIIHHPSFHYRAVLISNTMATLLPNDSNSDEEEEFGRLEINNKWMRHRTSRTRLRFFRGRTPRSTWSELKEKLGYESEVCSDASLPSDDDSIWYWSGVQQVVCLIHFAWLLEPRY